jgi:hypothetical protein
VKRILADNRATATAAASNLVGSDLADAITRGGNGPGG